jgi:hypothetical protein
MRKRGFTIAFIIVFALWDVAASSSEHPPLSPIPDGWYQATVRYTTSQQDTPTTVMLNVLVQSDRVVVIDLGNDSSVHAGANDAGYTYRGGKLALQDDWSSRVVTSAKTDVQVVRADGLVLRFDIELRGRPRPQ